MWRIGEAIVHAERRQERVDWVERQTMTAIVVSTSNPTR